jgi:hypothetical protein
MAAFTKRALGTAAVAACGVLMAASAAADVLYVGSPLGVVLQGDPRGSNFQFLGLCGGQIQSLALDGNDLFIGDTNGVVYHFDGTQGFVDQQFVVPGGANALLVNNGELLVGSPTAVKRVNKSTGAVLATLPSSVPVDALLVRGADVFVGSSFGAVFKGNLTSGNFQLWGTCTGPILSLAADGTHLWAGSGFAADSGVVLRFSLASQTLQNVFFTTNDATALVLHQGDLLVGGSNGTIERRQRVWGDLREVTSTSFGLRAMVLAESPEPGFPYCYATTGCPCGNNDAEGGCANSTQVGTLLGGAGTASVAADDLVLTATQMPANKLGRFYMGISSTQVPFGDGLLCAGSGGYGIQRFPQMSSGSQGMNQLGPGIVAFSHANFSPLAHIQPGWTWHFQVWHRDPTGPCGGTINTSNAYVVTFLP